MIPVPASLQRLADQIDGWLDLRCPERALELLDPMLADPAGRPAGLVMRIRARVRLGQYHDALADIAELRTLHQELDWIDLTEAWCRKRTSDLHGAIRCMEQLLARNPRSEIGHFNLGCYLALAGDADRAIDEVTLACGLDDEMRDFARDEPDLDGLRNDARFRQLVRRDSATDGDDDEDEDGEEGDDDEVGDEESDPTRN
ncbi:MAG TPA: hypothetical protein VFZ65_09820 [Planctomycetota bacterium]|nr:hypothetical protein [Planctomycetota bacterium]